MTGSIYLIDREQGLVPMQEEAYDSEDLLQELLAEHPDLLAGDQMRPDDPRRWLLITREAGVPGEEASGDRWSVDHLFLDQEGIPTLIEVKRSSDTRIRREVVGQMLDYAANAVQYWPVERIQTFFEGRCQREGLDVDQELTRFLDGLDVGDFWQKVKTNLLAGRIRLVFVADMIPPELRRIVEFLNEQMDPAEVIGLEVRQFVGEGRKTLVPRVIGLSAAAAGRKRVGSEPRPPWTEDEFMGELARQKGQEAVEVARQLLQWARSRGLRIWWGRGHKDGSFYPIFDHTGNGHYTFSAWTIGTVPPQFSYMANRPVFDDLSRRRELLARLNSVPGIQLADDSLAGYPRIPLETLNSPGVLAVFLGVWDWYLEEIRRSAPAEGDATGGGALP